MTFQTARRRAFALFTLLAVGCTSIAGLDDLVSQPASQVQDGGPDDGAEASAAEAGAKPSEAGLDAHADAPVGETRDLDAGADVVTPLCWLQNDCTCKDDGDCPGMGFQCCNGKCTDTKSDRLHCGGCGRPCPSNQGCEDGVCSCPGLFPDQGCVPNVCIDFMSDSEHCGSCTHSCLGGLCLGQACQAVPMATQQQEPMGIAVDDDFVYFANKAGNSVGKLPKLGNVACAGLACPLFTSPQLNEPISVATEPGSSVVYVTNNASGNVGNLVALPKDLTPGTEKVVATAKGLWGLALRAGVVYFTTRQDSKMVGRVDQDGGVAPLARVGWGAGDVTAVAVDNDAIFFGASMPLGPAPGPVAAGLFKTTPDSPCLYGPCTSVLAFSGKRPRSIALTSQYIFWTSDDDKIRRMSKSCAAAPCAVLVLAEGQLDPQSIVADDSTVYWANAGDGTIRHTAVFTTCKGITCQSMTPPLGKVYGLAQDGKALYFTTRSNGPLATGIVWRLAK